MSDTITQLNARVYIGTDPYPNGPHPGYRGPIAVDTLGVWIGTDCEWLHIKDTLKEGWADADWELVERECLVPWHRVDLIEITPEEATP